MDRLGGQKLQSFTTSDEKFMQAALEQVRTALAERNTHDRPTNNGYYVAIISGTLGAE